jgi:hypothetical protein
VGNRRVRLPWGAPASEIRRGLVSLCSQSVLVRRGHYGVASYCIGLEIVPASFWGRGRSRFCGRHPNMATRVLLGMPMEIL